MRNTTIRQLYHFTALSHANTHLTLALAKLGEIFGETKGNMIYFPEGLSQQHIAAHLNISKTAMKNRWAKLIEHDIVSDTNNEIVLHTGSLNE
ncbi:hypothetical protein HBP99_14505 [Listeria booriae]|uniref:hypothetical protein n=1 Tax=Listeria booriae TaxID=1552123 RepID=UPI001629576F|nr:hypothetical protein [Listeria booriae]MBC2369837.1 hypothetical protein [Listeria booriae]